MKQVKKERLQAKGWTVGSASDFLGLTPEEAQEVAIRLTLCRFVADLRKQQRMTQKELAARLGSSQSRVAKLEACNDSVSLDLIVKSAIVLGASGAKIGVAFGEADLLVEA